MVAKIIDGKKIAQGVLEEVRGEVSSLSPKPCLAIVMVGEGPASKVYTKKKHDACKRVGMDSRNIHLPEKASEQEVVGEIAKLNADGAVDAILVQLPLPPHIDEEVVLSSVSRGKDVDGFHPENFGRLALGIGEIVPCTPKGVIRLLKESGVALSGKHAVVIGRSRIVGKPLAFLLLNENCTVTVCHSKTVNMDEITRRADIICIAIGKPQMLKGDMIKEGAVVVDVGINRQGEGLVGDVDFESVSKKASFITPVPGGVGPMTIAMLMKNALHCYRQRRK